MLVATNGVAHAMASTRLIPNDSLYDGFTRTAAARYRATKLVLRNSAQQPNAVLEMCRNPTTKCIYVLVTVGRVVELGEGADLRLVADVDDELSRQRFDGPHDVETNTWNLVGDQHEGVDQIVDPLLGRDTADEEQCRVSLRWPVGSRSVDRRVRAEPIDIDTVVHGGTSRRVMGKSSRRLACDVITAANHEIDVREAPVDDAVVELVQPFTCHVQHDLGVWAQFPNRGHELTEVVDVDNVGAETSRCDSCLNCIVEVRQSRRVRREVMLLHDTEHDIESLHELSIRHRRRQEFVVDAVISVPFPLRGGALADHHDLVLASNMRCGLVGPDANRILMRRQQHVHRLIDDGDLHEPDPVADEPGADPATTAMAPSRRCATGPDTTTTMIPAHTSTTMIATGNDG